MTTVTDPVCGMQIDPAKAVGSSSHEGRTYYFCSRGCETKFDAAPEKYTAGAPGSTTDMCCTTAHSCC